jgi:hypothetical protein
MSDYKADFNNTVNQVLNDLSGREGLKLIEKKGVIHPVAYRMVKPDNYSADTHPSIVARQMRTKVYLRALVEAFASETYFPESKENGTLCYAIRDFSEDIVSDAHNFTSEDVDKGIEALEEIVKAELLGLKPSF